MSLRACASAFCVAVALWAGAVFAPQGREACRMGVTGAGALCASLEYPALVTKAVARKVQSAALSPDRVLLSALTSSPVLGVDFSPFRRLAGWWMQETGHAIMARHTLR